MGSSLLLSALGDAVFTVCSSVPCSSSVGISTDFSRTFGDSFEFLLSLSYIDSSLSESLSVVLITSSSMSPVSPRQQHQRKCLFYTLRLPAFILLASCTIWCTCPVPLQRRHKGGLWGTITRTSVIITDLGLMKVRFKLIFGFKLMVDLSDVICFNSMSL